MRSIAPISALAFLSALPAAAEWIWPEYSFPEEGFAAQFPGEPRVEERFYQTALVAGGSIKERVYTSEYGGVVYTVAVADFGNGRPTENRAIDEAARKLTSKGMLTHDVSARIDWHYGRSMRVEDGSGTSYTSAIFYIDNKVYQVEVAFPPGNSQPMGSASIHFFQQAFRLLP
jgi:hypothetical protein